MITASGLALILLAGDQLCALPVGHVGETMRPLPVETLAGGPPFAPGVSVIRGQPTPVVDLAEVLGRSSGWSCRPDACSLLRPRTGETSEW